MKIAITSEKEIFTLNDFLTELENLKDELYYHDFDRLELDESFKVLSKIKASSEDAEEFLKKICDKIDEIPFTKILFNCVTMLQNCADLTQTTLDFHPNIKKGLELLERQTELEHWEQRCKAAEAYLNEIHHGTGDNKSKLYSEWVQLRDQTLKTTNQNDSH
ncbi:hypothetical protein V6R21_07645 [Limibacter armeniacum]|uniref:hypothetical protein n=1 Tax=Limibacter armeniacum TaxID=466084 RepID=UPI002FE5C0CB